MALQPPAKGSLEVRNPDTLSLLQTIALPGAAQLHFPPPTVSLAHAGKGFHISSDRCVWKMDATDYDSQIAELIAHARHDEAISILNMLEDALLQNKSETTRQIKMQKADLLFRQRKYLESMDLFNEEDVHAPPEHVLRFFPRSIAGDLSAAAERDEEPEHQAPNGKAIADKLEPVADSASPSKAAGGGFTKMLLGHRRANSETASIVSTRKETDADDAASIKGKPADDHFLQGKELVSAAEALNSYLAGTRARLQRVIDPATGKLKQKKSETASAAEAFRSLLTSAEDESDEQLAEHLRATFTLVDTTMFRVLMLIRPTLASSLFRIPNFCDPDVVNERLLEHNRYTELVDFFYGRSCTGRRSSCSASSGPETSRTPRRRPSTGRRGRFYTCRASRPRWSTSSSSSPSGRCRRIPSWAWRFSSPTRRMPRRCRGPGLSSSSTRSTSPSRSGTWNTSSGS